MRFRTFVFVAALGTWPLAAGAQTTSATQQGPTPQQVLDSPKDTVGATVAWVVRYRNVIVDMQPDGKIASSRIAYEWRSSSGASAPILIVGPSLQDTRFAGESAGLVSVLHAEPRLLTGTVRGVHASSDADGRATLAIAVDGVTLGPLPISEKHRLGPGTGPGSFSRGQGGSGGGVYAPGQGVSWPEVLKETKPVYPVEAIASKREGSVELEIIITADGRVSDVRITKSLDRDGPFDKAALAAAKQWLFKPGTKDGVPVPTKVSLVLDFKIKK